MGRCPTAKGLLRLGAGVASCNAKDPRLYTRVPFIQGGIHTPMLEYGRHLHLTDEKLRYGLLVDVF